MVIAVLSAAGGLALIWIPVETIIHFEPDPTLTYGSGFGPPLSASRQRNDLIFDSLLLIAMGVALLVVAVSIVRLLVILAWEKWGW
ncbi:hypothetical protein J2S43_001418 [Catenuloplanes nepalensis]|uniref:Uncharacterized protein n=1 Tax=Catenuloplanes nepalensis TaxID=587533 RepID=A0ABT9MPC5_9ACTN|nr:hypothetical protein [Catenuloplanes nepalensis]MDP9792906.1 hypothetical protein [Catenuloplanes nepalensis]